MSFCSKCASELPSNISTTENTSSEKAPWSVTLPQGTNLAAIFAVVVCGFVLIGLLFKFLGF